MDDRRVAAVLSSAVAIIHPVLDILATRDPIGLKGRTFRESSADDSTLDNVIDFLAKAFDTTDFPGTAGWDKLDSDARSQWWVNRIGALNTVAVAFPGVFGILVNRLPIQDLLGFANQAMVLVAVARESGVTDRETHVALLGSVLCKRDLTSLADSAPAKKEESPKSGPFALLRGMWQIANVLRDVTGELEKRPHPRGFYRVLGAIPLVGGVAGYLGERGALSRAAKQGRKWLAAHKTASASSVTPPAKQLRG
ncbi:hypothetical protein QM588_15765 [Rhodococcus sp. IEGM 1354]|uniref:hypothetical protein n=1 Tax=Rhodococcus sp. IEGM 1354 TaxID=3047088 RepID=UPI0024B7E935|nr:hypothetical protein [Rhodococcus sp. IEGM 1354]MDI9931866.1 hypothetical protein [Rhodococcus sp. IEGM 1354]